MNDMGAMLAVESASTLHMRQCHAIYMVDCGVNAVQKSEAMQYMVDLIW